MKTKMQILDEQHWVFSHYKQRITAKDWRLLLLNDDDTIIFNGRVVPLKVKNLGYGVVEISKNFI